MERVKKFLQDYADAVLKIDLTQIAAHFHGQFVLSTSKDYWYIKNNDEFKMSLAKAFTGYKKLGATFCKLLSFEIIEFKSNHCLANIEWGLLDNKQNIIVRFDISYCIKEIDGNWKFIFVMDHNEEQRIGLILGKQTE